MGLGPVSFRISIDGTSQDQLSFNITQFIYFDNHFRPILVLEARTALAQHPFHWIQQSAQQVATIVQDLANTLSETVPRPQ